MAKKPAAATATAESHWPADKTERRPIDTLLPYANNARVHSEAQVAQLAKSIKEFGWTMPVLISADGELIAGHGRVLAAKALGLTTVPCMVVDGWSEEKRRAYVIADNRLALNATWDEDMLARELAALEGTYADLTLLGFDDAELAKLLANVTDPGDFLSDMADDVPDVTPVISSAAPDGMRAVPLTLNYLPSDRDKVVAFLNKIRSERKVATIAEALLQLAAGQK